MASNLHNCVLMTSCVDMATISDDWESDEIGELETLKLENLRGMA